MLLHWDGIHWARVTAEHGDKGYLTGVSALSSDNAWAVGAYRTSLGGYHSLTLHWDGSKWSRVRSPDAGPRGTFLRGVDAVAAGDVWGVGFLRTSLALDSMALHWNGKRWTQSPTPNPTGIATYVVGISASSASNAWAVGSYVTAAYTEQSLILRWDGTAWSLV